MKFKMIRPLALGAFAVAHMAFIAQPAQAAPPVDIDGALFLQNKLQDQLDNVGFGFTMDGPVTVEPAGTYYAVTLPHMRYILGSVDDTSASAEEKIEKAAMVFDVGISALNMVPTDKKFQYVYAQSLPTPWRMYKGKEEAFRIEIGEQKTNGIHDIEMNLPVRVDAAFKNVRVVNSKAGSLLMHIDSVTAKGGYNEVATGSYSGNVPIELNGFKLYAPDNSILLSVNKLKAYGGYTGLSRDNSIKCSKTIQQINKQVTAHVSQGNALTPEIIASYTDNVLACMGIVADGMEGGLVLEGFKLGPALAAAKGFESISFDSIYIQEQFSDITKPKMGASIKFGMQKFGFKPDMPGISEFAPHSFHFDVGLDNIPHSKLHEILRGVLAFYAKKPQELFSNPQVVLMPILARLPQMFSEAQSGLVINDVRAGGDNYQAVIKGRLQSNIEAIYGVSGKVNLTFYGFDKLMDGVAAEAQDPNNPSAMAMAPLLPQLKILQSFGRDDGKGNRVYDFEVTPQGQLTLNGQDFQALLGPKQAVPAQ